MCVESGQGTTGCPESYRLETCFERDAALTLTRSARPSPSTLTITSSALQQRVSGQSGAVCTIMRGGASCGLFALL